MHCAAGVWCFSKIVVTYLTQRCTVSLCYGMRLQLPAGTRRAVLMSGMSTAEVMEVIGAYSETGAAYMPRPLHDHYPPDVNMHVLAVLTDARADS